jgi:hypothetical protein
MGAVMSEVHEVIVTIKPVKGTYPGQVAYGWYTLQDGVVTLTDREGNPAGEETGRKFTHKLAHGEDARTVACKLTKELRLALRDNSAPVAGFEGPIIYPKLKY